MKTTVTLTQTNTVETASSTNFDYTLRVERINGTVKSVVAEAYRREQQPTPDGQTASVQIPAGTVVWHDGAISTQSMPLDADTSVIIADIYELIAGILSPDVE